MARKAFSLSHSEVLHYEMLQQEEGRIMSRFGAATIQLEELRKQLASNQDRQRVLVQAAVLKNGVRDFNAATIEGQNLICDVAEALLEPVPAPAEQPRINGAAHDGMALQK